MAGLIVAAFALFMLGFVTAASPLGWFVAQSMTARTVVTYDSEVELREAVDLVDGSVAFRHLVDEHDDAVFAYKFTLVNHTGADLLVTSARVRLLDADGFALNEHGWTGNITVPANGTTHHSGTIDMPLALGSAAVAIRVDGV